METIDPGMSRRRFLRMVAQSCGIPLVSSSILARAAAPADYRALVCVFLFGGNDSHNMIVPLDARFESYRSNRGPLALPRGSLEANAIKDGAQGSFGLHPRLVQTRGLFESGALAVISNVGVLVRPTTRADFTNRTQLPPQLFSHNDMQQHWHTLHPQAPVMDGWGGRLGDVLQGANEGQLLVSVSTGSSSVFLKGRSSSGHEVQAFDANRSIVQRIRAWRDWDTAGADPQAIYEGAITTLRQNRFEAQYSDVAIRALTLNDFIQDAMYNAPDSQGRSSEKIAIKTVFPSGNRLAAQLRSVAAMIAARQALGVRRQVFFVSLGSFDHHSDQFDASGSAVRPAAGEAPILFGKHADLLGALDAALKAFYDATVELGVAQSVTTFTASDFGRTLTSNGKGSDHGWGSHQLVMGGSTNGGRLFGQFHNMQVGNANPLDSGQGRLIPDASVDQYAATLARWMGATPAELDRVLPNLRNFGSQTDLGFLRA